MSAGLYFKERAAWGLYCDLAAWPNSKMKSHAAEGLGKIVYGKYSRVIS